MCANTFFRNETHRQFDARLSRLHVHIHTYIHTYTVTNTYIFLHFFLITKLTDSWTPDLAVYMCTYIRILIHICV